MWKSDSENCLPCYWASEIMVKLIWKLQTICIRVELWIVVEVSTWSIRDVTKGSRIFVTLLHSMTEIEKVERDLPMGKLCSSVFEELISWLPEV